MSEDPLRPNQEQMVAEITEHTTAEAEATRAAIDAAKADVVTQLGVLAEKIDNNGARIGELTTGVSELALMLSGKLDGLDGKVTALQEQQSTDHQETMSAVAQVLVDVATANTTLSRIEEKVDRLLAEDPPPPPPPPKSWQETDDLIDVNFRPVLGIHTGGEGQTKSNPAAIAERMGRKIQAAPIYWKTTASPRVACQRMLDVGTIPRLELCLPHIATSTGRKMGGTFWRDVAAGGYDDLLRSLLTEVGALGRPILLSMGHESDLRSEDGASPKNANPPAADYCGDWKDFPGYWQRFATIARELAPKARLFLNWSGGFGGDVSSRWNAMLPPAGTFDFFGYDFYNMYGKQEGAHWDEFDERLRMFGRWEWYKRTLPNVPLIVGETATCQGGAKYDAGEWLLNMVEFVADNAWQGVGTGGGISQVHYFSHHYTDHPRCLDEPHDGTGQMWDVLPTVGKDERFAWA